MNNNSHHLSSTMPLLRFTPAGSVDDGKSTLIGRLLFDSNPFLKISSTQLPWPLTTWRKHINPEIF
jgi:hypothetical protein